MHLLLDLKNQVQEHIKVLKVEIVYNRLYFKNITEVPIKLLTEYYALWQSFIYL